MGKLARACLVLTGVLLAGLARARPPGGRAGGADPSEPAARPCLRRPVALALADGGRWLFVANRRGGSVSVIDTASLRVAAEVPVGRGLADLAVTPDGSCLVA